MTKGICVRCGLPLPYKESWGYHVHCAKLEMNETAPENKKHAPADKAVPYDRKDAHEARRCLACSADISLLRVHTYELRVC